MAKELTRSELPYETYERITGKKWTGGKSADVKSWLSKLDITAPVGSEQANNELQRGLKAWAKTQDSMKPVASSPRADVKPRSAAQMVDEGYAAMGRSGTGSMLEEMPKLSTSQKKGLQGMKTSVDTLAAQLPTILWPSILPLGIEAPAVGGMTQLAKYGWGSMPGKELTSEGAKELLKLYTNPTARAAMSRQEVMQIAELLKRFYSGATGTPLP
jgi:hypothetical protein